MKKRRDEEKKGFRTAKIQDYCRRIQKRRDTGNESSGQEKIKD